MKIRTKVLLPVLLLALILPAFCALAVELFEPHVPRDLEKVLVIVNKKGEKHAFDVELAITKTQQAKGLMFVKEMPLGSGMLFLFRMAEMHTFWMKDTLIPLDMLFIEEDGRIQHIHSMAKPQDRPRLHPVSAARLCLKLMVEWRTGWGLKRGMLSIIPSSTTPIYRRRMSKACIPGGLGV
ncbi:MAG: DUF192 domain-containing protein [Alphaproteobacteria bacterium]|nr:DUF192 domain-containing protein [Alphaproteobacteria bacterium]